MSVVIENDSIKIILGSMDKKNPFEMKQSYL